MSEQLTKIMTGRVRASYANVFEPRAQKAGDEPKYSIALLIDKSDKATLKAIDGAINAAIAEGTAKKWGGKQPAKLKLPLRDGDEEQPGDENYTGKMFLNARSPQDRKPGIVGTTKGGDGKLLPIVDPEEFYSGCYCRATITFYAYESNGSKGVAVGLNNIQKLADGPRLSGGASAEEDFSDMEIEDDDDDLTGGV